jgi:hypothetical protein
VFASVGIIFVLIGLILVVDLEGCYFVDLGLFLSSVFLVFDS